VPDASLGPSDGGIGTGGSPTQIPSVGGSEGSTGGLY
jgi:hypothetical protein